MEKVVRNTAGTLGEVECGLGWVRHLCIALVRKPSTSPHALLSRPSDMKNLVQEACQGPVPLCHRSTCKNLIHSPPLCCLTPAGPT